MISPTQEQAFWDLLCALDESGILPYVMVVGSWAEYLYTYYYGEDYTPNIRTLDVDILYRNINLPKQRTDFYEVMRTKGFVYVEDPVSGIGKFVKDAVLEIEILTRSLGRGDAHITIPAIGLKTTSFRSQSLLNQYPLPIEANELVVIAPEPSAYLLHKLYINHSRDAVKQEKDRDGIRLLLAHMRSNAEEYARLTQVFDEQPDRIKRQISKNVQRAFISDELFAR